jgi:hypothetical protein
MAAVVLCSGQVGKNKSRLEQNLTCNGTQVNLGAFYVFSVIRDVYLPALWSPRPPQTFFPVFGSRTLA